MWWVAMVNVGVIGRGFVNNIMIALFASANDIIHVIVASQEPIHVTGGLSPRGGHRTTFHNYRKLLPVLSNQKLFARRELIYIL